ncbi:MAG: hypothetical protein EAZ50_07120 [Runella slithyformis]|nr:MAG: hypothetical protein EAZ80_05825 [Runella slithyformis]TAF81183.1 MAG: hypothetical protein EAZ50_07120 [Runella slithyformis]
MTHNGQLIFVNIAQNQEKRLICGMKFIQEKNSATYGLTNPLEALVSADNVLGIFYNYLKIK